MRRGHGKPRSSQGAAAWSGNLDQRWKCTLDYTIVYILYSITLTLCTQVTSFGRVGCFAESGFELGRPIDQSTPAHDGAPHLGATAMTYHIRKLLEAAQHNWDCATHSDGHDSIHLAILLVKVCSLS